MNWLANRRPIKALLSCKIEMLDRGKNEKVACEELYTSVRAEKMNRSGVCQVVS